MTKKSLRGLHQRVGHLLSELYRIWPYVDSPFKFPTAGSETLAVDQLFNPLTVLFGLELDDELTRPFSILLNRDARIETFDE